MRARTSPKRHLLRTQSFPARFGLWRVQKTHTCPVAFHTTFSIVQSPTPVQPLSNTNGILNRGLSLDVGTHSRQRVVSRLHDLLLLALLAGQKQRVPAKLQTPRTRLFPHKARQRERERRTTREPCSVETARRFLSEQKTPGCRCGNAQRKTSREGASGAGAAATNGPPVRVCEEKTHHANARSSPTHTREDAPLLSTPESATAAREYSPSSKKDEACPQRQCRSFAFRC